MNYRSKFKFREEKLRNGIHHNILLIITIRLFYLVQFV